MSILAWTYLFVGVTFGIYLLVAWLSRVKDTKGFYVAGQGVPAAANGMATAADWMSAASYISMAGLISTLGYAGGQYLMGWTGGYVLLALMLAPYLRKFGRFTVPDFVGDRYSIQTKSGAARAGSPEETLRDRILRNPARFVAVLCAIFVSFTYVAGQMRGVGVVFSRFLEVDVTTGVVIGMCIVFVYATLGGMKGITWTQVVQYWVLITAFLIPAVAISIKLTGQPLPQVGLASPLADSGVYLLDKLNQVQTDLGFASYTDAFGYAPDERTKLLNVFCVTLALMVGTAGLPHVIVRFYTVKNVRAARWSGFWALLFIALLYLTAPATGAFARYFMLQTLNGATAETLPDWYRNWEKTGLIAWVDFDGDGRVAYTNNFTDAPQLIGPADPVDSTLRTVQPNEILRIGGVPTEMRAELLADPAAWVTAHGGTADRGAAAKGTLLALGAAHGPDNDIIVLATPEMAELANWIIALVAAGGLAAALSTASGLLLVISSSVAHDLYYRVVDPTASEASRLLVGRIVIGLAVVVAGIFGIYPPGFVSQVVAFAFGLAASSFFPAIVLGIFAKRVGTVPAVAGMLSGIAFTGSYIIGSVYADMPHWCLGIGPQGIGTVGMALNFAVTLALTPLCKPPAPEVQTLIESLREPEPTPA